MRKLIMVLTLLCFIIQLAFSQTPFEGVITYKVETKLKFEDHPYNEYYSQKYGDTLKIFIAKNGDQKREYSNTGKLGLDWIIYDQSKNEQFAKWHSMDSIFYYDCSQTVTKFEEIRESDEKLILNKICNSIITKEYEPKAEETISQKFYFSGEEFIVADTYKNFKDGSLNKVYAKSKSHFLRWEMDLKYIIVIFEAIKIDEQQINPNQFRVPDKIKLVKM